MSQWAVSSVQRHATGGEAALHSLPRPFTHLHIKPWHLRTKSVLTVTFLDRPAHSQKKGLRHGEREWLEAGVELRPGQGLLAPRPASISCLGWSWRNCSQVPALEREHLQPGSPPASIACGGSTPRTPCHSFLLLNISNISMSK